MNRSSVQIRPVARESQSLPSIEPAKSPPGLPTLLSPAKNTFQVKHENEPETDCGQQNEVPVAEGDIPEIGVRPEAWHKGTNDEFSPDIPLPVSGMATRRSDMPVGNAEADQRAG